MRFKTIAQIALLTATVLSCGENDKKSIQNDLQLNSEQPVSYDNVFENPAYIEVYNEYVTYLNDITASYDVSQTYYFNAFPDGYPQKLTGSPSLVTISDYPDNHLENALNAKLKIASLEKPAKQVNETILTLRKLMNTAEGYYDRKDFLDDDAKLGKTLHDSIVPVFTDLNNAVDEYRYEIAAIAQKMTAFELESYKNQGLKLRYAILKILMIAKETEAFTNVETMDDYADLNLEKVSDVRKRLNESVKELEKIAADKSQFAKEFGSNSLAESSYNFGFKGSSNTLIKHLRKLEERLANDNFEPKIKASLPSGIKEMMTKEFYKESGMPQSIIDAEGKLIEAYNKIID